jgi:hypothetical protein
MSMLREWLCFEVILQWPLTDIIIFYSMGRWYRPMKSLVNNNVYIEISFFVPKVNKK